MSNQKSALIFGASRGLGLAIVQELLNRGWNVIGTVRDEKETPLHALAEQYNQHLEIEYIDITETKQIAILKEKLNGRCFNLLFVNVGITNDRYETIGEISTEEFIRVMVTNALSTMRVVEQFTENIRLGGTIGVMSSGQGSIANNVKGEFEIYRASKAALYTLMRCFAARRGNDHALLLLAPGWVKTDMGGPDATFTIEEVLPDIVNTLVAQEGKRGLQYIDRFGKTIRW